MHANPLRAASQASQDWNRTIGWCSLAAGAGVGLILGLWSFDGPMAAPGFLGQYQDLSRRLARLGHIALFGLGLLNLFVAVELSRGVLGQKLRQIASVAMNLGNLLLPTTLFVASLWHVAKYAMALPATCVFVALACVCWGVVGDQIRERQVRERER